MSIFRILVTLGTYVLIFSLTRSGWEEPLTLSLTRETCTSSLLPTGRYVEYPVQPAISMSSHDRWADPPYSPPDSSVVDPSLLQPAQLFYHEPLIQQITHVLNRINQPSSFNSSFSRPRALDTLSHCSFSSMMSSSYSFQVPLLRDSEKRTASTRPCNEARAASSRATSLSIDVAVS